MTFNREHSVAWTEIPVSDLAAAIKFYNAVFHYELAAIDAGINEIAMFPGSEKTGIRGHLYPGKPAADGQGSTIHLYVPDGLEAAMARCTQAGGTVVSDIVDIPAGRFAYAKDIDGNSLGLFESKLG